MGRRCVYFRENGLSGILCANGIPTPARAVAGCRLTNERNADMARQMTVEDRKRIDFLLQLGWTPAQIAEDRGRSKSTILHEIINRSVPCERGYRCSNRTWAAGALYHIPAPSGSAARKIPQRARIPSPCSLDRQPNGLENLKATTRNPITKPKQVLLLLQWCVYFRALRHLFVNLLPGLLSLRFYSRPEPADVPRRPT